MQPESGRTVYAESDFPHPFQLRFSKEGMVILCKTDPDLIWMAWSGFGQTHLVWKQADVYKSLGPVSGRTQPACYQFPTFRLGSILPQTVPDNTVQNQPGSDLFLADCVSFWPNGPGPEASQCARIIRPASGQCFPADPDRHVYSGCWRMLSFAQT